MDEIGRVFFVDIAVRRVLGCTYADVGLDMRGFFAGESRLPGRVVLDAFDLSYAAASEVLDAFEIESRIL